MTARTFDESTRSGSSAVSVRESRNECVSKAVAALGRKTEAIPRVGIVLGSGLGGFADDLEIHETVNYDAIPGFSKSTAPGHAGRLIFGSCGNVPVVVLQGRAHLYEGHHVADVTFPVRVLHAMGIRLLVLTNASGGLNSRLSVGDLVVIDNHIDMTGAEFDVETDGDPPISAWNRVPRLYDPRLVEGVLAVCRIEGFEAQRGTYVAVTGPNYETRAEYRMFRSMGGDVVGMSTVPEALVAARLGLDVVALSTVTNVCNPDQLSATDGESVVQAAAAADWKLRVVLRGLLSHQVTLEGPGPL